MRFILDTHVVLAVLRRRLADLSPPLAEVVEAEEAQSSASVASLWEIAIKTRLGKLNPGMSLHLLPQALDALGVTILPVTAAHALAEVEPLPRTRDPFDRLLLAQCSVEDCRLATLDHALVDHPLAARLGRAPRKRSTKNPKTRP